MPLSKPQVEDESQRQTQQCPNRSEMMMIMTIRVMMIIKMGMIGDNKLG